MQNDGTLAEQTGIEHETKGKEVQPSKLASACFVRGNQKRLPQ
ncbi:hypothetical protein HMPREF3202_01373 [Prevotella bivia]|uniref:Uncharacterized protein n=1 Tax=Prevotella bivia TaxID=28125 RepID=A0A137SVM6_9BACT|nr:hypothetical protein HMPREF3202_01373 [Prevotella bivia]